MTDYPFGQTVLLSASFINALGVLTNPTTTTFRVGLATVNPPPDPTAIDHVFGVDAAVLNPSTGNFDFAFLPSLSGNYVAVAVGTGVVQAATRPVYFRVLPNPFA